MEMYQSTHLGFDIPFFPRQVIPHTRAAQLARRVLQQLDDLGIVCDGSAMLHGRHDEGDIHPRVIVLTWYLLAKNINVIDSDHATVVIDQSSDETVTF